MKNFYDIWQNVCQEGEEIKENYYATLTKIGVHGKSTLSVSKEDIDKKFGAGFDKLFSPDKKIPVRLVVSFNNGDDGKIKSGHLINIIRRDNDENTLSVILHRFEGIHTRDWENMSDEEFEKDYVRRFYPEKVTCWRELFVLFDALK